MKVIWLRHETKAQERRTPLVPEDAKRLISKGIDICVESSAERIFKDCEYEKVGCKIVEESSWNEEAPIHAFILGLKELPDDTQFVRHRHIYFAHVYKGQTGAAEVLERFKHGGGKLFDLEYLVDENSRRVSAFGRWAGFVGSAMTLRRYWSNLEAQPEELHSYENINQLMDELADHKNDSKKQNPKVIIIGAKGKCGRGAKELFERFNIETTDWDIEETRKGGPFSEILDHDIFINSVLMQKKIPPFLTKELISNPNRLKLIGDVSCDPNSELNPIPIYSKHTDWERPFTRTNGIEIMAVDNLPSILPRESSEDFSSQLTPHLENLLTGDALPDVWKRSLEVYESHLK